MPQIRDRQIHAGAITIDNAIRQADKNRVPQICDGQIQSSGDGGASESMQEVPEEKSRNRENTTTIFQSFFLAPSVKFEFESEDPMCVLS